MSKLLTILDKPKFNPKRLGNLQLWLDASDPTTITKDGSNKVSQWDDKSSKINHMTQGTGSNQPGTRVSTQNGKNMLTFDGGDSMARVLSSDITGTELTAFMVAKRTSAISFGGTFSGITNGEANDYDNSGSLVFYEEGATGITIDSYNNNTQLSTATHPGNGAPYIVTTKFDGNNNTMYLNNSAQTQISCTNSFSFHTFMLGARYASNTAAAPYTGSIGEVILYDRALSAIEITTVYRYLSNKWGIY